jgi:hypothetical protein
MDDLNLAMLGEGFDALPSLSRCRFSNRSLSRFIWARQTIPRAASHLAQDFGGVERALDRMQPTLKANPAGQGSVRQG